MISLSNLPNFIQKAPTDGVWELYLDHSILSSARMCEARFWLDYVEAKESKGMISWPLAYGSLIHKQMEHYYKAQMEGKFELRKWLEFSVAKWYELRMPAYKDYPQFKSIGGFEGFVTSTTQYAEYYNRSIDNLKPIALEIPFGKAKEVPLLEDHTLYRYAPFRLYLSGRMDFIFDNGRNIGPLDHKSFSIAGKNPVLGYEVQEGMTGYVYAMDYIYKNHFAIIPGMFGRSTNILWLNFMLTKTEPDLNKKFQRIPLYKTPYQLEAWRMRQISTAAKIYQLLFEDRVPDFNAHVCTNYFHSTCPYQPVHRLGTEQDMFTILSKDFQVRQNQWNPEAE
jgi:hypothetical protein